MRYIAACSNGKDSLAMVLKLIEKNEPLDEVIFYDTGMEFEAIYTNWNKLQKLCKEKNIKTVCLKTPIPFEDKAFKVAIKKRNGEIRIGKSWCGGRCRWGTYDKVRTMDKYCEAEPTICYIGIALDETNRIAKTRKEYKKLPLVDWGMTEEDCLNYCREKGWNWEENGVDLYDVLDRVSCWCCRNKNKKELRNIFKYLPEYWGKLKEFQAKTNMPMKKYYKNKKEYGTVFELEEVFKNELMDGARENEK